MGQMKQAIATIGIGFLTIGGIFLGQYAAPKLDNRGKEFVIDERRVFRTYEVQSCDQIYVEDPIGSKDYVIMKKYLSSIPNADDRNLERARIEKLVGWLSDSSDAEAK